MSTDHFVPVISFDKMTFDEYDAGITALNGRTVLHESSNNLWYRNSFIFDNCYIQFYQEGASNSYESETVDDFISIGFALDGPTQIQVNGLKLNENKLVLLRPGDAIATFAEGINNYCIISFPSQLFLQACQSFDPPLKEQLMKSHTILDIETTGSRNILNSAKEITKMAQSSEIFSFDKTQEVAIEDLLAIIFDTMAGQIISRKKSGRPAFPLQRTIKRIHEYLAEIPEQAASVSDMARYVGSSERKLRQDIKNLFGVSPKRLLSLRKMHNIHASLLDPSSTQSVTEILANNGIWEVGRFASSYHQIFNEYPSETLKSKKY